MNLSVESAIHKWIPGPPSQLYAGYSIHQRNLNYTGIDELTDNHGVLLYPNPTQGELTLVLNNKERIQGVELTDAIGRLITVPTVISGSTLSLDVSSLSGGMYVLNVVTDATDRLTKKFIVQ